MLLLLCFRNVAVSDEGAYVCRAANEGGFTEQRVWLKIQSTSLRHLALTSISTCSLLLNSIVSDAAMLLSTSTRRYCMDPRSFVRMRY